MNTIFWTAQGVMAATFLTHGLVPFPPPALRKLKKQMPFPATFLNFICVTESPGALGLILPGLAGVLPWLKPLAAAGLAPVAGGAAMFHLTRRDVLLLVTTLTLFALAAFVAHARSSVIPL